MNDSPLAPARTQLGPAFYLAGDSFPSCAHVEDALRDRLHSLFSAWTGQDAFLARTGAARFDLDLTQRMIQLRTLIATDEDATTAVLIGRSSGARLATSFAARHGADAVICLGYPFRAPNGVLEPERFSHLATIKVPTLIIQGLQDPYGGIDITVDYAMSPSVRISFVQADHQFDLTEAEWDMIGARCASFCQCVMRRDQPPPPKFDNAYYLARHRDVAEAVAAGQLVTGEQHFISHGRKEGRSYRIVPEEPVSVA